MDCGISLNLLMFRCKILKFLLGVFEPDFNLLIEFNNNSQHLR